MRLKFYLLGICFVSQFSYGNSFSGAPSDSLSQQFNTQAALFPQEKIYAQIDRSSYMAGDTIWLRPYLVNAQTHLPDAASNYVYAELINPLNKVAARVKLLKENGVFAGHIPLEADLPTGIYQLRFYTRYMTGMDEAYFFKRNVRIGNYLSAKYRCNARFEFGNTPKDVRAELCFRDNNVSAPIRPDKIFLHDAKGNRNTVRTGGDSIVRIKFKPEEMQHGAILLEYQLNGYVQKEFISVPVREDDFEVSFFPEGGNLLPGVMNRVAFKAINSSGLGEEICGFIVTAAGDTLVNFSSQHLGMGSFAIHPEIGQHLFAVCKSANSKEKRFALPSVASDKISLRTDWYKEGLYVSVNKPSGMNLPANLSLIVHCRGMVIYNEKLDTQKGMVMFERKALPTGVIQALLLDDKLHPLSERLVFNVNSDDQPQVNLSTDKPSYEKRENIRAEIQVTDSHNKPLEGRFSVSITDDGDVMPDSCVNILSSLLLTSELKGYIEHPACYFTDKDPKARNNLDLLMMTQGWRRYNVENILKKEYTQPESQVELTQEISGCVNGGYDLTGSAKNYPVTLIAMHNAKTAGTFTNEQSRFAFPNLIFTDGTRFLVQSKKPSGSNYAKVTVDTTFFAPQGELLPVLLKRKGNTPTVTFDLKDDFLAAKNKKGTMTQRMNLLKQVVVTAPTIKKNSETKHWGSSEFNKKVTSEEIERTHPSNMLDLLRKVPGLVVDGRRVFVSRSYYLGKEGDTPPSPLILVDGVETPSQQLNTIMPQDVDEIEVAKGANAIIFGCNSRNDPQSRGQEPEEASQMEGSSLCGVIIITLKKGADLVKPAKVHNIKYITPLGYQVTKEFYSPQYETKEQQDQRSVDARTTIYWNPDIPIANDGKGRLSFYTSDSSSDYSVVIEGITSDGKLMHKVVKIRSKRSTL